MTDIEALLKTGADANTKDIKGFSLLMNFASHGDLESIQALVTYGASINATDFLGYRAIDYAISANSLDSVKFLIENGSAVTIETFDLAINKRRKLIVDYFDNLDPNKYMFLRKKRNT